MAELLPARLAQAAGLDLDAMLSGRLRESDWGRLSNGAADLDRCLSGDQKPLLAGLLAHIDVAAQQPVPEPAPILSKDATRIVVALMQADGNTLRTDTLHAKLAKPRMPRDALANALAELRRTGQAAEIDGAWHLLGGVITI